MLRRNKLIALGGSTAAIVAALALALTLTQSQAEQEPPEEPASYEEIRQTFGTVPSFIRAYPDEGIDGAWEAMRDLQLSPETALSGKQKELVGLAVASQIPCDYCAYFHTEAARLHGASQEEVEEAIAVGAQAQHLSTSIVGLTEDLDRAQAEIIDPPEPREEEASPEAGERPEPRGEDEADAERPEAVTDAESARREIRETFGTVPEHVQRYPSAALPGIWKSYRDLMMSEDTALSRKDKELIAAASATESPCLQCIKAHERWAREAGATDEQFAEAIAMAAQTRHWSTVLNGNQIDEEEFRSETRQIIRHIQEKERREAARERPARKASR